MEALGLRCLLLAGHSQPVSGGFPEPIHSTFKMHPYIFMHPSYLARYYPL